MLREERLALAARFQNREGSGVNHDFFAELADRLRAHGIELPGVTVEFRHLNIHTKAVFGAPEVPTLYSNFKRGLQVC